MSPAENDYLTCEDCDEASEDVRISTAPVHGWQENPPEEAALCSRCHDRRLRPADHYDGPDRRDEDGS